MELPWNRTPDYGIVRDRPRPRARKGRADSPGTRTGVPKKGGWPVTPGFLWDFLTGGGEDVRCYRDDDVELEEMKKSPGAERVRKEFYRNCGRDTRNIRYGTAEAFINTAVVDGTWFTKTGDQVGGFAGASATVNPDGTVTFTIPNTAGLHSFAYHALPDTPVGWTGPGRTIQQTFQWTEPIDRQRCILTPKSRIDPEEWAKPASAAGPPLAMAGNRD